MPLEAASFIYDLIPANPAGTDGVSQGDDHLRLIKQVLQNTFTNVTGPEVPTSTGTPSLVQVQYSYAPASYSDGQSIAFVAGSPTIGAASISVNNGPAVPIFYNNVPLSGLVISPGNLYILMYYNGVFNIMASSGVTNVTSFNMRVGAVTLNSSDITGAGGALSTDLGNYLPLAGGTLSNSNNNQLTISKPASGQSSTITGTRVTTPRWAMALGDTTLESISNIGSNFVLSRYADGGAFIDNPFTIDRQGGTVTVANALNVVGGIVQVNPTANLSPFVALTAPGGQNASVILGVTGQKQWRLQSDPTGNFNIIDVTDGNANYFSITPAGVVTIPGLAGYLPLAGGTVTGALGVGSTLGVTGAMTIGGSSTFNNPVTLTSQTGNSAILTLIKMSNSLAAVIFGSRASGLTRWALYLGNSDPETSGNQGTNFQLDRYSDTSGLIDTPLRISRATGIAVFSQIPTAPTATAGDNSTQLATTAFVTSAVSGGGSFLPITGGTITGNLAVTGTLGITGVSTFNSVVVVNGAAGTFRSIFGSTANAGRWRLNLGNNTAESGGNVGSDFQLDRLSDGAALIDSPLTITRSTGIAAFVQPPTHPTPALADNTTKSATTAYINSALASLRWNGTFA